MTSLSTLRSFEKLFWRVCPGVPFDEGVFLDYKIVHHFSGDIYAKEMRMGPDHIVVKHKHDFDHLSILASGTVLVDIEGEISTVVGPACLIIKAGRHHGIRSLTDVVWYCVHYGEPEALPDDQPTIESIKECLNSCK